MRYEKMSEKKLFIIRRYAKFSQEHFLIGHIVFVLIVRNFIQNEEFYFAPNLCEIQKKLSKEIVCFEETYKLVTDYFFIYSSKTVL